MLIAADKIVELVFTPADQSMQLSATVYADWQFKEQAFPNDVIGRWVPINILKNLTSALCTVRAEDLPLLDRLARVSAKAGAGCCKLCSCHSAAPPSAMQLWLNPEGEAVHQSSVCGSVGRVTKT